MKNKILPALLLVVLGLVGIFSCRKSSNGPIDRSSTTYFPLAIGKFVTYQVDTTYYIATECKKSVKSYQIRYSVTDTTLDTTLKGHYRPSYIIDVSIRNADGTGAWKAQRPMVVTPSDTNIVVNQDGLVFIKLVLPVYSGSTWKGNALVNTNDSNNMFFNGWNYTYTNVDATYNDNLANFNHTVTVIQNDLTTPNTGPSADSIAYKFRSYSKEIYARNIGLVYKEYTYYKLNQQVAPCIGGYTVIMRAIDHN